MWSPGAIYLLLLCMSGVIVKADVTDEVNGLVRRLLGNENAALFNITVDPSISKNEKDTFSLFKTSDNEKVIVVGSSGVSAAWGVHHYLVNFCHCHISWDGDQLSLPDELPQVNLTIAAIDKYKYYQNVCTTSYSFVWWDWPRWEREIDWMALNGINLALAFGAQEAIWRRVFDGLGVNNDSFAGPAFLSWQRMGNLKSFGGGLSEQWHKRSIDLQHLILDRMRILGITPVLPAFSGILPPAFQQTFPKAAGARLTRWNHFPDDYCCPFLLSPSDPLFAHVSRLFIREYIAEFGTNHIYNCDTFNENNPDSKDPEYLADTARAIFEGMAEADPAAIWMVQGWMFLSPFWGEEQVKAYVTSIPIGKMLILDLQSDLTPLYDQYQSYYGQPFIWCTLHNFGGVLGLYGHLENVNRGIVHGRKFKNSTMVGLGLTPEGINQNYIMYDFTLGGTIERNVRNMTSWISNYIRRRYGFENEQVDEAWQILRKTVYNYNLDQNGGKRAGIVPYDDHIAKSVFTKLPTLTLTEMMWYDRREVYDAFQLMLSAAVTDPNVNSSKLFAHDLVDVTRQIVQLSVGLLYLRLVDQFTRRDAPSLNQTAELMLNLMADLDDVLKTNKQFMLGPWLESAKAAGQTPEEKELFEWNARNQITLWGPGGEIRDYASKQWSGMVSHYYRARWQTFLDALRTDLAGGTPYDKFSVIDFTLENVEIPFTKARDLFPVEPEGESIETILRFNSTWGILNEIFSNQILPTFPSVISMRNVQSSASSHL